MVDWDDPAGVSYNFLKSCVRSAAIARRRFSALYLIHLDRIDI